MRTRKPKKKGNAPAFQFYVGDFMTGTITMSLAEVGGYIRLLGHQWSAGSVPGDDIVALARAMACTRTEAVKVWANIRTKFCNKKRTKKTQKWINFRLEQERRKQRAFSKAQSKKGIASAKARTAVQPKVNHEVNQNPTLHLLSSDVRTEPPVVPQGGRARRRVPKHLPTVTQSDIDAVNQQLAYAERRDALMAEGLTREQARDQIDRERNEAPAP